MSRFRRALAAILVALIASPAYAATPTSLRSGRWADNNTWDTGTPPVAGDEATIVAGHNVDASGAIAAGSVTVAAGADFHVSGVGTVLSLDGNGAATFGGMDVSGVFTIGGGATVQVDPDNNGTTQREDGAIIRSGGLVHIEGPTLYSGKVAQVTNDNFPDSGAPAAMTFTDPGVVQFDGVLPTGWVVVFRSGLRKGRWYNGTSINATTGLVTLDASSRNNHPLHADNLPKMGPSYALTNAQIAINTATVTNITGFSMTDDIALGSWFYCSAVDGIAERRRIRRVVSASSVVLMSNYGTASCAAGATATIVDDNQPPIYDSPEEQIRTGDLYDIILPGTFKSTNAADGVFTEQTFLTVLPGAGHILKNASIQGLGKQSWTSATINGVQLKSGLYVGDNDGTVVPMVFDTVEVTLFGGEAGVEYLNPDNFTMKRPFVHWAHPLATANEGHGIKFKGRTSTEVMANVMIEDGRVMHSNDDCYWRAGATSGSTSGVYDSICKFLPMAQSGNTVDAYDTLPDLATSRGGGQWRIERPLSMNLGGSGDGSCLGVGIPSVDSVGAIPASTLQWTGTGLVYRDGVCLNVQNGYGAFIASTSTLRNMALESISVVNSLFRNLSTRGAVGGNHFIQNVIQNYALNRFATGSKSGMSTIADARGNIVVSQPLETGAAVLSGAHGIDIGNDEGGVTFSHWNGSKFRYQDNVLAMAPGSRGINTANGASWSTALNPAAAGSLIDHNLITRNSGSDFSISADTDGMVILYAGEVGDLNPQLIVSNNAIAGLLGNSSQAIVCANDGAVAARTPIDRLARSVGSTSGPEQGCTVTNSTSNINYGLNPDALDFNIRKNTGAFTLATDGTIIGPRFAGVLAGRLPMAVRGLPVVVNPGGARQVDADGDGIVDFFDNCDFKSNPDQSDPNGDGTGAACSGGGN